MQNTALSIILKEDHSWRDEHRAEDDYLVQLRALSIISPEFVPAYSFNHTLPAFSSKIRYHERKFHNAVTDYLNRFRQLLINPDDSYIAFHIKKHNERTRVALNAYYTYLSKHLELLNALTDGTCADYFSNRATKESVTLASYMFWALIWCNMEVQHLLKDFIIPDNRLSIDDHFYRLLQIAPLQPCCVSPIVAASQQQFSVQSPTSSFPSIEELAAYLPDTKEIITTDFRTFTAKLDEGGFFRLPKVQQLSRPQQAIIVQKLQTAPSPFLFALAHVLDWYEFIKNQVAGFQKASDRNRYFASVFNVGEREAAGFINVLNPNSSENKDRYNTCAYIPEAEALYKSLLPTIS